MAEAISWFVSGGPVMPALLAVGILLYTLLFERATRLVRFRWSAPTAEPLGEESFTLIRALIGAAPLLGLLGTVSGLIQSFESLVDEALVSEVGVGIGHALRTTQYGMALAAPAVLIERVLAGMAKAASLAAKPNPATGGPEELP